MRKTRKNKNRGSMHCPACAVRIPPQFIKGWAAWQLGLGPPDEKVGGPLTREGTPVESKLSATHDNAEKPTKPTPPLLPLQVPPEMTEEEIGAFSSSLYREALSLPEGRQCIDELKALGALSTELMIEAVFMAGAVHALMHLRVRPTWRHNN
jgi:hypothetical protein